MAKSAHICVSDLMYRVSEAHKSVAKAQGQAQVEARVNCPHGECTMTQAEIRVAMIIRLAR